MDASMDDLWLRILTRLGSEVPSSHLDAYLKNAHLVQSESGDFEVQVENRFAREALAKHRLEERIQSALAEEGLARAVRITIQSRPRRRRADPDPAQGRLGLSLGGSKPLSPPEAPPPFSLNPKYTMESFVVGDGNRLAYAICEAVSASPGKVYNPVFVYGGVGLGKTHLMQAVGHEVHRRDPHKRILYVSSEVFSNEYIRAVKEKATEAFRKEHRRVDVLLIDDVQFFGGKEGLQEEFFHTFNELYQSGKQIILTSDRSPKQLSNLQERLVSRFESGVVTDIKPLNVETRTAILLRLAEGSGLKVEPGTLELLAERIRSNIRLLEGAFTKVLALCSLHRAPVRMEIVQEVVREYAGGPSGDLRRIDIGRIQEMTSEYFHLGRDELCGRRRTREVVLPRQIAMFLAHEFTEETLESIARAFGKKDHTTVMHACEKIRGLAGKGGEVDAALRELRSRLRSVESD